MVALVGRGEWRDFGHEYGASFGSNKKYSKIR